MTEIENQVRAALGELLDIAAVRPGGLVVIGCSSSEILGEKIGKGSSPETGKTVAKAAMAELEARGLFLAAQCCEHLNRALIIEQEAAEKFGYEIVNVCPKPKAGGSFATAAWAGMQEPVAVEFIKAHMGMDIGGTLIGMHLRRVAVPVRTSLDHIGGAIVLCARTRPKYIGGPRAVYQE